MILGIGIDSVEIARFANWHTYCHKRLSKIFSNQEIDYCLATPAKSAERFAVRFAAREALFKAYSSWRPQLKIPFLSFCKSVTITKKNGIPTVILDQNLPKCTVFISLSHSQTVATAFVVLERSDCK